jgi:MFS family permease
VAVLLNRWWIVAGSTLALVVSTGPIMQFTFGVFLKPIMGEFHVSRGLGSLTLTIGLTATALLLPVAGVIADRWGPRRLALAAVSGLCLLLVATATVAHSYAAFLVCFTLAGIAATGQTPLPYTRIIVGHFDDRRGLALALALTGVGIGAVVLPIIAQALVGRYGWRGGYLGIALLLAMIALPSLLLLLPRDPLGKAARAEAAAQPGLSVAGALRTYRFWLLLAGVFLAAAVTNGTIAHVVPLLTDRGVDADAAVRAVAWLGAASIVGRIAGGWALDRYWASWVALVFLAGLALGIWLLLHAPGMTAAAGAAVLLGLGLGIEADLVSYLLARHFGLKSYGSLFGLAFGAFMLASSLGPVLMGWLFDLTGSYVFCLNLFIAMAIAAAGAMLALGRYRY